MRWEVANEKKARTNALTVIPDEAWQERLAGRDYRIR